MNIYIYKHGHNFNSSQPWNKSLWELLDYLTDEKGVVAWDKLNSETPLFLEGIDEIYGFDNRCIPRDNIQIQNHVAFFTDKKVKIHLLWDGCKWVNNYNTISSPFIYEDV
jgi:hypothetical protein